MSWPSGKVWFVNLCKGIENWNMSTKDNPDTLPINLYAQVQPTITPLDSSKIAEDGQDGARTSAHHGTNSFIPRQMLSPFSCI